MTSLATDNIGPNAFKQVRLSKELARGKCRDSFEKWLVVTYDVVAKKFTARVEWETPYFHNENQDFATIESAIAFYNYL